MHYSILTEDLDKITCALDLSRHIVGMKFVFSREHFVLDKAKELTGKIAYCVMVAAATKGHSIKATADNFACLGGARALGIVEMDEYHTSARLFESLGLYQDLTTARNVVKNLTCCQHRAYGIIVKPLSEFIDYRPDVVIIVANAYNAMRIVQGYTYTYGTNAALKMTGNQAICSECTAYPYESNHINISTLCAGTRFKAHWKDDELALGLPFNKFSGLVSGVYSTINAVDPNEKKTTVEAKLKEMNRTDIKIEYDRNYFTGLYEKDIVHYPENLK